MGILRKVGIFMLMGYEVRTEDKKTLTKILFSSPSNIHVVSGNPEVLYNGIKNPVLKEDFLREDTFIIPDGIGVVRALSWRGHQLKKLAGIELADEILLECNNREKSVFLLGSTEEANEKARQRVESKYPNIKIAGAIDGFYYNERKVINQIKESRPDVLFVAMGCPRQEEFIIKHREELNIPIMMGVGGTFDVWANVVKRAPNWAIKLNLEWLYRLIKQPERIGRYKTIIKFMWLSKQTAKKEALKKERKMKND